MKKVSSLGVLASGLLLLGSSNLYAAGFVNKTLDCPSSKVLIPEGGRIEVSDIAISNSSAGSTTATVFFGSPRVNVMTAYLSPNDSLVSNFEGQVESLDEQPLKVECQGTGNISVTVTGGRVGDPI